MTQNNECQNCGAEISKTDKRCPYCGTANPNYSVPAAVVSSFGPSSTSSGTTTVPTQSSFSVPLFIVLLIFFWPAAIVYAIVKAVNK